MVWFQVVLLFSGSGHEVQGSSSMTSSSHPGVPVVASIASSSVASPLAITMPGSSVIHPRGLHISGCSISGRGRALLPLPPPVITHTVGFGQGRGGRGGPWYGGRGGGRG